MNLKTPIFIVNFKTNKEATGKNALKLAKICEKVAKETKKSIAIAVEPTILAAISKSVKIPVLAQHADGVTYGSNTGHILPEAVKEAGAVGSLLNHSEDQYEKTNLKRASERLKELNMTRVICANTPKKAQEVSKLNPEFIAIEPPELIGNKNISVATAKPEVITKTVDIVKKINPKIKVLCGAGVHSKEDVKIALKLGAQGILIATAVVKAKNPKKVIEDLVSPF